MYGVGAAAVLYILAFYLGLCRRVVGKCRRDAAAVDDGSLGLISPGAFPSVSVIVYVNGDANLLPGMLPLILEQDYPAPMEVIVVNDGERAMIEEAVGDLELQYSNLYLTFTPPNSRNLSRKKLSLTIGAKAARYDTLVMTTASCQPGSPLWLRAMMSHVAQGADLVVGYSVAVPDADAEKKRQSRVASFDIVSTSLRYLSWAIQGRPYRADGNNLAYRREVFVKNRGFSTHFNFNFGDDDIFVRQVAPHCRTAVELSPDSIIKLRTDDLAKQHAFDKQRYDFTGRHIPNSARWYQAAGSWAWWIWLLCSVGVILAGLPSVVPAIAVTLLSLGLCVPLMISWRRASRALFQRPLMLTVPWLMLVYPFYNMWYRLRSRREREKNYTWTSHKLF